MTRGKILFIDESELLYESLEFNGDMYPDMDMGRGRKVIQEYLADGITTEEEYREYVARFDQENFGYARVYGDSLIQRVVKLESMEYDVNSNWTDYLYIVNCSGKEVNLLTEKGMKKIQNGELGIVCFQALYKIMRKDVKAKVIPYQGAGREKRGYKQIIIVRKDLNLSPGKLAAQCCHGAMAFLAAQIRENARYVQECYMASMAFGKELYEEWLDGEFTKCILEAPNKSQLLKAKIKAEEMGMVEGEDFFLIKDNCHTELVPEEYDEYGVGRTLTSIGFRPMMKEQIDQIGKKYHLYM